MKNYFLSNKFLSDINDIGYKNSTKIAQEALQTGKSVYDLVLEHNLMTQQKLDDILNPENMLNPHNLD